MVPDVPHTSVRWKVRLALPSLSLSLQHSSLFPEKTPQLCSDAWAALPAPGQALSCNTRWGSAPLCTQAHIYDVTFPQWQGSTDNVQRVEVIQTVNLHHICVAGLNRNNLANCNLVIQEWNFSGKDGIIYTWVTDFWITDLSALPT